jgi:hypothetical protein
MKRIVMYIVLLAALACLLLQVAYAGFTPTEKQFVGQECEPNVACTGGGGCATQNVYSVWDVSNGTFEGWEYDLQPGCCACSQTGNPTCSVSH